MTNPAHRRTAAKALMVFGVVYGLVVGVLVLTGVLSSGLWFTVAGMVLLALSQWMTLRSLNRGDRPD